MTMEKHIISNPLINTYCCWMGQNEKSQATIRKYQYFLEQFHSYAGSREITWRLLMNPDGGVRRGGWFDKAEFIGEVSAVLTLPFADLSVYGNWTSTRHHFNVGISLGIYITAPQFLR